MVVGFGVSIPSLVLFSSVLQSTSNIRTYSVRAEGNGIWLPSALTTQHSITT